MQNKISKRATVGVICLIVVALTMGWFVGQYIPGQPRDPELDPYRYLFSGNTYPSTKINDFAAGSSMRLTGITQGEAYRLSEEELAEIDHRDEYIEAWGKLGVWKIEYSEVDITLNESKTISASAFAEWHPEYYSLDKIFDSSSIVIVDVAITNKSDGIMRGYISPFGGVLPTFTLWSNSLIDSCDELGTGLMIDFEAFYILNEGILVDSTDPGELQSEYVYIRPGETQNLKLPFTVPNTALQEPNELSNLDLSEYCIQVADYDSRVINRLWLT